MENNSINTMHGFDASAWYSQTPTPAVPQMPPPEVPQTPAPAVPQTQAPPVPQTPTPNPITQDTTPTVNSDNPWLQVINQLLGLMSASQPSVPTVPANSQEAGTQQSTFTDTRGGVFAPKMMQIDGRMVNVYVPVETSEANLQMTSTTTPPSTPAVPLSDEAAEQFAYRPGGIISRTLSEHGYNIDGQKKGGNE